MRKKLEPSTPKENMPELSEAERTKFLEEATASLKRIFEERQKSRQGVFRSLAALAGDPDEKDRIRLIWKGLVRFANECMTSDTKGIMGIFALRATLALCVYDDREFDEMSGEVFQLEVFEDVYSLQKKKRLSPEQAFSLIAEEFQPQLRQMLAWVADPNRLSIEERQAAFGFLIEHSEQQLLPHEYELNDRFDETGSVGSPIYFWKSPRIFESIAAPVARFIFGRLELFHEGQIELDEAVPVVLCKREGCETLSIARRRTRDFCST